MKDSAPENASAYYPLASCPRLDVDSTRIRRFMADSFTVKSDDETYVHSITEYFENYGELGRSLSEVFMVVNRLMARCSLNPLA